MWLLTCYAFGYKNAFFTGFMGKHCPPDYIPNGIHTLDVGFKVFIYRYLSFLIGFHSYIFKP